MNHPTSSGLPSLLAITSQIPWPLDRGGHLRTFHLLSHLTGAFDVRLVAPVERSSDTSSQTSIEALEDHGIHVRPVAVGVRRPWTEAARVVAAAIAREPYVLYRRHRRARVRAAVGNQCAERRPDLLYLDHLDSLNYAEAAAGVPIVADMHNVYSAILERAADEEHRPLVRRYLRGETRLLQRMERRVARTADLLTAVSTLDARHYAACGARRITVVPNGVDCGAYRSLTPRLHGGAPVILYVGTMSWGPNISAARFLALDVLPRLRATVPGVRLRIVGRDPVPSVLELAQRDDVEVTGAVADVGPHWRDAHVLAVPLEVGGGTRIKILEAFAAGVPVVSSPVGCEGLDVEHGTHLLVAAGEQFAASLAAVLTNHELAAELACRAQQRALERYDWSSIGAVSRDAAETLLRGFSARRENGARARQRAATA